MERLLSKAEKHIFRAEPGHREAMREAMDSLSKFVLGKDPITHRNRTLIGADLEYLDHFYSPEL